MSTPTAHAGASTNSALVEAVLAMADDNLVLAQRLGEVVSHMPDLEHDIASANLGLDHLGQARALYTYAGKIEGADRDEDALAMGRSEREFRNAVLVEQPNRDFAYVMGRQLLFDAYQVPLCTAMVDSTDVELAGIAAKGLKEARYHLRHSSAWVVRLGDGTTESHRRMQGAIDSLWHFSADLFELPTEAADLVTAGVLPEPETLRAAHGATVAAVLEQATLTAPDDPFQRLGGRTGLHTEHLGHLLAEMQWLYRSQPGAHW